MPRFHSALLLTLASAVGLFSACSRRETLVQAGDRQGVLHIGNGAEVQYLDPHIAGGAIDHNVLSALFEGLVTLDEETLLPRPGMAARWETSPDGLTYTFKLRDDVTFCSGKKMTAKDVVASINHHRRPDSTSSAKPIVSSIVSIEPDGDNAVVIALACRSLPAHQQKKAIVFGSVGAIVLRVVLTFFAVMLLDLPYLKLIGAAALLWIGVGLLKSDDGDENLEGHSNLAAAIKTIVVADLVMSLDNVIGVAAAAN
eukprot:gene3319-4274_t